MSLEPTADRPGARELPFEKWSGAGNDFILIEARHLPPGVDRARLAAGLCRRGFAIGADGLLVVDGLAVGYWNADGSEADFCGNGARCAGRYLLETRREERVAFVLGRRCTWARRRGAWIEVGVEAPRVLARRPRLPSALGKRRGAAARVVDAAWIDAGVPHLLIVVDAGCVLAEELWSRMAAQLQQDPSYASEGTNVTLLTLPAGEGLPRLLTWERGVCGVTRACGSGALAAAWGLWEAGERPPFRLLTPGGESLEVEPGESDWVLRGPAVRVFRGTVAVPAPDRSSEDEA